MPTKENYTTLFDSLLDLEDQKKELSGLIKEKIDLFGEQHGLTPKGIKKAYRDYKEFLKDAAKFHEADADAITIMDAILTNPTEGE